MRRLMDKVDVLGRRVGIEMDGGGARGIWDGCMTLCWRIWCQRTSYCRRGGQRVRVEIFLPPLQTSVGYAVLGSGHKA